MTAFRKVHTHNGVAGLEQCKENCKVCVGGAVLTQEYADMIGADAYGKDAMETVKYAQKVFGC